MNEKIKLETMYYHLRELRHLEWLANHRDYAISRKISRIPDGIKIEAE